MKKLEFINKIVKQGNSLCVRIPKKIIKDFDLGENDEVLITVYPQKKIYSYDEKSIKNLLKIANKIPSLNKFSETKKRFFLILNFKFLEETSQKDKEKKQIAFINKNKKEFGNKLIDEFLEFSMTLNKEAFVEEEGVMLLKKIYRSS